MPIINTLDHYYLAFNKSATKESHVISPRIPPCITMHTILFQTMMVDASLSVAYGLMMLTRMSTLAYSLLDSSR